MISEIYFSLQILLAIILGGILGWQRVRWGKSAGPRTYALVTAGAALFTIMARNAFGTSAGAPNVAAQIVTGIGFLGVGLIFHREERVEGLTTAAGLWASAAVGMAVGASYYVLSILTTLIIFFVLMLSDEKLKV